MDHSYYKKKLAPVSYLEGEHPCTTITKILIFNWRHSATFFSKSLGLMMIWPSERPRPVMHPSVARSPPALSPHSVELWMENLVSSTWRESCGGPWFRAHRKLGTHQRGCPYQGLPLLWHISSGGRCRWERIRGGVRR